MQKTSKQSPNQQPQDKLWEKPTLYVETHLKIFDPETGKKIVDSRV
jgi:hypothetical protein